MTDVPREDRVAVEDEVALSHQETVDLGEQTANHVDDPMFAWGGDDAREFDCSSLKVDHEQDVATGETAGRENLDREEVCGADGSPMSSEEGRPLHWSFRRRVDPVLGEDAGDCSSAELVAEHRQVASELGVAPAGVIGSESNDEGRDVAGSSRPTRTSTLTAVVFGRNELPVPPHQGVRRDYGGDLREGSSSCGFGFDGETPALGVGQKYSSTTDVLLEHAVLLTEVCELRGLLAVEPPCKQDHEELKEPVHAERAFSRGGEFLRGALVL